jgi:hypothetical protein
MGDEPASEEKKIRCPWNEVKIKIKKLKKK